MSDNDKIELARLESEHLQLHRWTSIFTRTFRKLFRRGIPTCLICGRSEWDQECFTVRLRILRHGVDPKEYECTPAFEAEV